jgi:hypothetical protein
MSWQEAKEDAAKWLQGLDLMKPCRGDIVDLLDHVKTLPYEGHYRRMVLRAVERHLARHDARMNISEYD